MSSKLSADSINAELSKAGLPEATVLEEPKVEDKVDDTGGSTQSESSTNNTPVIAGTAVGAVVAVLAAVAFVVFRKRRVLSKADLNRALPTEETSSNSGAGARPSLMSDTDDGRPGLSPPAAAASPASSLPRLAENMRGQQLERTHEAQTAEAQRQTAAAQQLVATDQPNAVVGEFRRIVTESAPVTLDSVNVRVDGAEAGAARPATAVEVKTVKAYEMIDFTQSADKVKKDVAFQIRNIKSNAAFTLTSDVGVLETAARPMEAVAVEAVAAAPPDAGRPTAQQAPAALGGFAAGTDYRALARARMAAQFGPADESESDEDIDRL